MPTRFRTAVTPTILALISACTTLLPADEPEPAAEPHVATDDGAPQQASRLDDPTGTEEPVNPATAERIDELDRLEEARKERFEQLRRALQATEGSDETGDTEPTEDESAPAQPEPTPEPVYEPVEPATISRWVEQLGSRSYAERETARKNLIKAGPQVLGPVVEAAQGDVLEVSVRAMSVFNHLYARSSGQHADAVEAALDTLLATENASTHIRARRLVEDHYELREQRAVDRIAELGGTIERTTEPTVIGGRLVVQPSTNAEGALSNIVLDPDTWKGGDEGLVYLKRLTRLSRVYIVDGAVTDEAREELVAALPNLDVQGRGKAYLGIGGSAGAGGGCFVTVVKPGTAADKAGLQPGDQIQGFAGKEVEGFPHLVELIAEHSPGEKVTAKVLRNNFQEIDVEITLGRWTDNK